MDWSFWLGAAVVLIIFEIITPGLYFFCFAVGAVAACLVSFLNLPAWVEVLTFAVISIGSVYFIRPLAKKYMLKTGTINSNVDALVGKTGIVTEVSNGKTLAKVSGEVWVVISNEPLAVNDNLKIKEVQSNKLIVEKVK